jgi:hypothetical protein
MYSLVGNPPLKSPSRKKRPICSLVQQLRHRPRPYVVFSRQCHTIMHNAWRVGRDSRRSPLIDTTVLSLAEFVARIAISGGGGRLRCERGNLRAQNYLSSYFYMASSSRISSGFESLIDMPLVQTCHDLKATGCVSANDRRER